jgi:hypothetical protein
MDSSCNADSYHFVHVNDTSSIPRRYVLIEPISRPKLAIVERKVPLDELHQVTIQLDNNGTALTHHL